MLGDRHGVTRAVQHANDHERIRERFVIDGMGFVESDPRTGRKLVAGRPQERPAPQRRKFLLNLGVKPRGDCLRGFEGDGGPVFREVGFRRFGQAEGERAANSFLPRSMMRFASKSLIRPSATSVSPLSMSALSAASS